MKKNLKKVRENGQCHLYWPTNLGGKWRGGAGYVVDWDNELEHEWCAGQEHKLVEADPGDEPDEIENRMALGMLAEAKGLPEQKPKRPSVRQTVKSNAEKAPVPDKDDFPGLDET